MLGRGDSEPHMGACASHEVRWLSGRRLGAVGRTDVSNGRFADFIASGMIGSMKDWIEHFREAAKGLVVAYVWRGYGSALFIEFGKLTSMGTRKDGTPRAPSGEIGLMIEADWRIEDAHAIVCGSSSDEELWEPTFARLVGEHVVDVATFGRLPEVLISLSDGFHVASFSTLEGDPEWTLFDRRGAAPITVGYWSGAITEEQVNPA